MLVVAASGFDKTLCEEWVVLAEGYKRENNNTFRKAQKGRKDAYPCKIELGLYTDHVTFFLVLGAQDL